LGKPLRRVNLITAKMRTRIRCCVEDVLNMQANRFDSYLTSFTRLVRSIAPRYSAIFILVDSIDFYDHEWEHKVLKFIKKLKKLIRAFNKRQQDLGEVLKMLVAASSQSSCFSASRDSIPVLHIPEDIDGDEDSFEEFARTSDGEYV
jgi:hypothetical protein